MSKSISTFIEKWRKSREKGMVKHALIHGSIWGGGVAIINLLLDLYQSVPVDFTSSKIYIQFVLWIVGGVLFFGPSTWFWNEKKYNKINEKSA